MQTYLGLPEEDYYSPRVVLFEFNNLLKKYGQGTVFSQRKYQQDRELWIASLLALGASASGKETYWVGYGKDNTPDAELISFHESEFLPGKGKDMHITSVEIMEYEGHSTSFEDEIVKKLKKNYPPHFRLLVFSTKPGTFYHDNLVKIVEPYKPNFTVLFMTGTLKEMNLWELYPRPQWIKFDAIRVANQLEISHILSVKRGSGYGLIRKKNVPRKRWDEQ